MTNRSILPLCFVAANMALFLYKMLQVWLNSPCCVVLTRTQDLPLLMRAEESSNGKKISS